MPIVGVPRESMMKALIATALLVIAATAAAQATAQSYPSCDLKAQRAIRGELGGTITDPRQAHVTLRADILEADLSTARKARRLPQTTTDQLHRRVQAVRDGTNRYTMSQGFLSAGELASFDRELDAVATGMCRHAAPGPRPAVSSDSDYLQNRAVSLDRRIDAALTRRRATRREAERMHLAVGQVQTEAGHLEAVNGTVGRADADRMNQRLTDVERALTHQP